MSTSPTPKLSPQYQKYADRLRQLIPEGEKIIRSATGESSRGRYVRPEESAPLHAWVSKVENILQTVFGEKSAHFVHYSKFAYDGKVNHLQNIGDIVPIIGILHGALDDLEGGFLDQQELLVSAVVIDDVLSQARELCDSGYKDVAAVLVRVALETAIRKIAKSSSVDDSGKVAAVNDRLKDSGRFTQPLWRQVQAWVDIGNEAAHGNFDKYTIQQVSAAIDGVGGFIANELR